MRTAPARAKASTRASKAVRKARTPISIIEACFDVALFGPWFRKVATWRAWFVFLKALFALPMGGEELVLYRQCTGRADVPTEPATEGWLVCGRRAGKSFILAIIAVFIAVFRSWAEYLAPGERGTVMVIATDKKQARTIYRYVSALLRGVALIAPMIERETAEQIDLNNSITIEISAASFRTVRGRTIIAALLDEMAFWPTDDAAEPDFAVLDAIRPAMATVPGALLLCASSPYARRGALWTAFRKFYGKSGRVLVWRADTRSMNPTVPEHVIAEAYERDPASAAAEYGAEFRSDLEAFVALETIEALIEPGVRERAPVAGVIYSAFCDPAGGSGADAMTLAITHNERGSAVLDAVREQKPPFSPAECVASFARVLKSYRIVAVDGDRYAGEWPRESFAQHGITYRTAEQTPSDIYTQTLPLLNSKRVMLLDDERLTRQYAALERRTTRAGRDLIGHPPGSHDDICNAASGALLLAHSGMASSTLWHPSAFLAEDGRPAPVPNRADCVFAVIVAAPNGLCGIAFCGHTRRQPLCVLDVGLDPLSPRALRDAVARLAEFSGAIRLQSGVAAILTTAALVAELARLGYHGAVPIDKVIGHKLLPIAAAPHIGAGRVRLCAGVTAKNFPLGFLQGTTAPAGDDPLRLAVLASIVVALDQQQSFQNAA